MISQCRHRNKYKLKTLVSNKHFPPGNKLYKIFNKNILKFSYSCIPNLKDKIDGHNNKILETTPPPKTLCNCLKKENCPNRGGCFPENILYYGNIKFENETYKPNFYKGICETIYILLYIYIYIYIYI